MTQNNNAIGVFDSGIGGLTVVKQIKQQFPQEDIIYFGDIARLPYGTKSIDTIRHFASETVEFLLDQQVKALVIACNTISAVAKDVVLELAPNIPVVDVISAGSSSGNLASKTERVGVIATPATINSKAYVDALIKLNPDLQVFSQACSLFVPLIEEGFTKHRALDLIAKDYLDPLLANNIDTLILGCTHYPLIHTTIKNIIGRDINIVDPAIATCDELNLQLQQFNLLTTQQKPGQHRFLVTEMSNAFLNTASSFLYNEPPLLELVQLNTHTK